MGTFIDGPDGPVGDGDTSREVPEPKWTADDPIKGTVREPDPSPPADESTGAATLVRLVPCLTSQFRLLRKVGGGGEATVLLVQDARDVQWVVKQYHREGWAPNAEVLERLDLMRIGRTQQEWAAHPMTRSLLWLQDWGVDPATRVFYEVQEYLPGGALAAPGPDGRLVSGLNRWPLADLTAALVEAVAAFHKAVGGPHRDVKPENLLIRSTDPLVLVLADLGIARDLGDLTHRYTKREGTVAYQSPKASGGYASQAGDWWAVGMILAEASLGHHPYALPDGSLPADPVIHSELAVRDVPGLDRISDERLRQLCQGLLTRDDDLRWDLPQVRDWQQGGNPTVHRGVEARSPRVRSVAFGGVEYQSPDALAAAFAAAPVSAGEAIFGRRDETMLEDLGLLLGAYRLDDAAALVAGHRSGAWQRKLLRLIAEMHPELTPQLAGVDVTPAGMAATAIRGIEGAAAEPSQLLAADWIVSHDLWRLWRGLPGMADANACADRLHPLQQHLDPAKLQAKYAAGHLVWTPGRDEPAWTTNGTGADDHVLVSSEEADRICKSRTDLLRWLAILGACDPGSFDAALADALKQARQQAPEIQDQAWWAALNAQSDLSSRAAALALVPAAIAAAPALSRVVQRETAARQAVEAQLAEQRRRSERMEAYNRATARTQRRLHFWESIECEKSQFWKDMSLLLLPLMMVLWGVGFLAVMAWGAPIWLLIPALIASYPRAILAISSSRVKSLKSRLATVKGQMGVE